MNNKIYFVGFIFLVLSLTFVYWFAQSRLKIEAEKLLDYTYVTYSPAKRFYVGFVEDCTGKMAGVKAGNCIRIFYYYDRAEGTRGTCFLAGGQVQGMPMFEDMEATWINSSTFEWSSTWTKGRKITQNIDKGGCDETSLILDQFKLMPSLKGTIRREKDQVLERVIQENKRLIDEATRVIQAQ